MTEKQKALAWDMLEIATAKPALIERWGSWVNELVVLMWAIQERITDGAKEEAIDGGPNA